MDPGLYARSESSRALVLLGYPDQARKRMHEALAQARGTTDPLSLAFALAFAAFLHQFLREPQETLQLADECLVLCSEYGIAEEHVWVMPARGWALVEQGEVEAGVSVAIEGLALQREILSDIARPQFLCHLIEALAKAKKPREALAAAAEALSVAEKTGDHYYDAEVYRLKGEMVLRENGKTQRKLKHASISPSRSHAGKTPNPWSCGQPRA